MSNDEATEELLRLIAMPDDERERFFASLPPDGTSNKLVDDLMAKPQSEARDWILHRARNYVYDDFKSILPDPCPKVVLHGDLKRAGFDDLAQKVVGGDYDRQ